MAYRLHIPPKPKKHRSVVDVVTPMKVFVHNGSTGDFAFPCWYQEVHKPIPVHIHSTHMHDHLGWPSPMHPGHSCQMWSPDQHCCSIGHHHECSPHCLHYIDMSRVFPIHLLSDYEGYSSASIAWNTEDRQPPEGVTVTAEIDPEEDWVVRVYVDADDPNATDVPQVYRFTVFVNAPQRTRVNPKTGQAGRVQKARTDIVALAELTILPSAYLG